MLAIPGVTADQPLLRLAICLAYAIPVFILLALGKAKFVSFILTLIVMSMFVLFLIIAGQMGMQGKLGDIE